VRAGLDEAETSGIVVVSAGRVEFTHPLLVAAAIELASRPAWRAMHSRLGAQVTDPERKARHWALARPEPDEEVAVALDAATESAAARGAPMAAAELARLALDRTVDPAGLSSWRRRLRLAELLHITGATAEAGAELAGLADCRSPELRARGWLLLTEVAYQTSSAAAAEAYAQSALTDAGGELMLKARALLSLSVLTSDGRQMAEYAADARRCLEAAPEQDFELLAWTACTEVGARFHLGEGLDRAGIDRAQDLERTGREWRSNDQVAAVRPVLLKWADYPEDALAALAELRLKAEDEGNDGLVPYAVGHISGILLRMGRTEDARAAAAEHLSFAEATGQESQRAQAMYNGAMVAAQCGELAAAEAAAMEILGWAERENDEWMVMSATAVLGFVALSRDLPMIALPQFDRWQAMVESQRLVDPGITRYHGDHIEALIGCGELDRAMERTEALAASAARAGRTSAAALALRCRGMLAAADGDHPSALRHLDGALALHAEQPIPFERGRTLLVKGVVRRRAKEKRAAGDALAEAAAVFETVGAAAWRDRAQAELGRVGRRTGSPTQLTATEQRIAELAATGLTNRQVAEQAFISPKTVEANLARVYRKLGISSRAELGAWMAAGG
ncbi:MAG: helix-turn-helix transcriptional regulator, partial [Mycobacteriales bacterium]